MSPYVILLIVLFFTACLSVSARISRGYVFTLFLVMTLMMCLRYGQGTDYGGYYWTFNRVAGVGRVSFSGIFLAAHGEPLYILLCYVVSLMGDFRLFVALLSVFEMAMIWSFMRRNSSNMALSLLIFASVTWMIYFFSILRQGLALSIFLGYGTKLIERRQWGKYLIMSILLTMIHAVSAIYLIVPVVMRFSTRSLIRVVIMSPVIGAAIFIAGAGIIPYSTNSGIRFVALAERVLSFAAIYMVYASHALRGGGSRNNDDWMMKLYCFGMSLYVAFMAFSLVASRIAICFKVLEMVIVPKLTERKSRYRQLLIMYFIILSAVMFIHSIMSELETGGYISSVTPLNYPYVSIFNERAIFDYRPSLGRYIDN